MLLRRATAETCGGNKLAGSCLMLVRASVRLLTKLGVSRSPVAMRRLGETPPQASGKCKATASGSLPAPMAVV